MENKKVRNATPTLYNGIKFRSVLEARVARVLKENNISFEYEPFKLTLLSPIEYEGVKYRAVTYTPDFVCGNFILEVKGFPNDVWPVKKKMIIHKISENKKYKFREISTIKQLNIVIKEIKSNKQDGI